MTAEIKIYNQDNRESLKFVGENSIDLIYADYIYENLDFSWAEKYWSCLKERGIFIAQTDWHSDAEFHVFMKYEMKATLVNKLSWKCEWGNHPKDRFHQCYDDILIYSNVKSGWKFRSERIQVKKATTTKGLNPSGRITKTATAWIDDIVLTTTAKERVKKKDGHLVRWQKPLRLYDRIIAPFSDEGDMIVDPFMGSGSLGLWCKMNNRNYIGIEYDKEVFELARENIFGSISGS